MESFLLFLQSLCHSETQAKLEGDVVQEVVVHQAIKTVFRDVQATSPCEGVGEEAGVRADTVCQHVQIVFV